MEWISNLELEYQYRQGSRNIKSLVRSMDNNSNDVEIELNKSLLNSMASGMYETSVEIHQNVISNYNSFSQAELNILTGIQRKVVELRQIYKPTKVGQKLNLSPPEVTIIFNQAIVKIQKRRNQEGRSVPVGLSKQQEKIYELLAEDKPIEEISKVLGITWNTIRVQKKNIEKKIGKISLNEFI